MLGVTWTATLDAALDEISRLRTEHDNALDALMVFITEHPEYDGDEQLTLARLALL